MNRITEKDIQVLILTPEEFKALLIRDKIEPDNTKEFSPILSYARATMETNPYETW